MNDLKISYVDPDSPVLTEAITQQLFGLNLIFDRDRDPMDATGNSVSTVYAAASTALNSTTFRYPGGTVSERLFDLTDPFSGAQNYSSPDGTYDAFDPDGTGPIEKGTLSLKGALDFAAASGRTMTFVMPTYRFLGTARDGNGNRREAVDAAQVYNFVKQLLTEAHNRGVTVEAIELGNEWHVDNTATFGTMITPIEYGRIASRLADVIQSAIDDFIVEIDLAPSWNEPDIVAQVGPGGRAEAYTEYGSRVEASYTGTVMTATELIFREFNRVSERQALDGLVTHRYLTGDTAGITGWAYRPFDIFDDLARQDPSFSSLRRYVTEWNIAGRNTDELGLRQAGNIMRLFCELLEASVDHANIWAVQQNNGSRLTNNVGLAGEDFRGLSVGGEMFRLLSLNLPGARLSPILDSDPTSDTYVFVNSTSTYVYVVNNLESTQSFSLDTTQLAGAFGHGYLTILGVENSDYLNPRAVPKVSVVGNIDIGDTGTIQFNLNPHEVVQIVLTNKGDEPLIFGSDSSDVIVGSSAGDHILAGEASDYVFGSEGDDDILGGGGVDHLHGGTSNDGVDGGDGDDYIFGGAGDDILAGGKGVDYISGGLGADLLLGGDGTDYLAGSEGDDAIDGGEGADILDGGDGNDSLRGGIGNDTIEAGSGRDFIYSGMGRDTIIFNRGDGSDNIYQFVAGMDLLHVRGFSVEESSAILDSAVASGNGVSLTLGGGDVLWIDGLSLRDVADCVIF